MRQFLLATALIAVAIVAFIGGRGLMPTPPIANPLGDLSAMEAIVTDVATLAASDLPAATLRIKDLEGAWDDAEPTLRAMDGPAWTRVDDAIDAALSALRADAPDPATVQAALADAVAVMADPGTNTTISGGIAMIGGVAVSDAAGHPIPCEDMIAQIKDGLATHGPQGDVATQVDDLLIKATERCNADDDRNADAHSAAALQLLSAN